MAVIRSSQDVRRAAILVNSLDHGTADRLLQQLPEDESKAIRDCLMTIADVDPAEERAAIQQFLSAGDPLADPFAAADDAQVPEPHVATLTARHEHHRSPGSADSDALLHRAPERLIAECLAEEMPQAIAVALAQLPTDRASEVVSYLPTSVQAQVLERLVQIDASGSLELTDIREEFQQWLHHQIERSMHRAQLAARLAAILEAAPAGTRQRILHNVAHSDARLAKELRLRFGQ